MTPAEKTAFLKRRQRVVSTACSYFHTQGWDSAQDAEKRLLNATVEYRKYKVKLGCKYGIEHVEKELGFSDDDE